MTLRAASAQADERGLEASTHLRQDERGQDFLRRKRGCAHAEPVATPNAKSFIGKHHARQQLSALGLVKQLEHKVLLTLVGGTGRHARALDSGRHRQSSSQAKTADNPPRLQEHALRTVTALDVTHHPSYRSALAREKRFHTTSEVFQDSAAYSNRPGSRGSREVLTSDNP